MKNHGATEQDIILWIYIYMYKNREKPLWKMEQTSINTPIKTSIHFFPSCDIDEREMFCGNELSKAFGIHIGNTHVLGILYK